MNLCWLWPMTASSFKCFSMNLRTIFSIVYQALKWDWPACNYQGLLSCPSWKLESCLPPSSQLDRFICIQILHKFSDGWKFIIPAVRVLQLRALGPWTTSTSSVLKTKAKKALSISALSMSLFGSWPSSSNNAPMFFLLLTYFKKKNTSLDPLSCSSCCVHCYH